MVSARTSKNAYWGGQVETETFTSGGQDRVHRQMQRAACLYYSDRTLPPGAVKDIKLPGWHSMSLAAGEFCCRLGGFILIQNFT